MTRRLTLRHAGRTFLDRWGLECRWFGIFVHHIAGPDPGLDLHDHPWPFVTLIIRGGYSEHYSEARLADCGAAELRTWRRWSVHRIRLTDAHRIIGAKPGTWTIVVRGRKARAWGFFEPDGWVDWRNYDYETRRPLAVESNHPAERVTAPRHLHSVPVGDDVAISLADRITLDDMGIGRDA